MEESYKLKETRQSHGTLLNAGMGDALKAIGRLQPHTTSHAALIYFTN